ncbi:MAG: tetratricopeptide repeat protein [Halieaceae bacterium]
MEPGTERQEAGFVRELHRRRIWHIAGGYIAAAWLGAEIISFLLEQASAPPWSFRLLAIVFAVGFPVAMVIGWVIQVQPDGNWAIDRVESQQPVLIGAIALGLLVTAGLSWYSLPGMKDPNAFEPLPNSLAILPLQGTTNTASERTIAETLYTALLEGLDQSRELTQVRLRLISRPADITAFGREVRVAALLDGRIVNEGGRQRVDINLLDVADGSVRWTRSFDWDPTNIMTIGNDIANGVLSSMALPELEQEQFAGTDNRDAYDAYLLGQESFASLLTHDMAEAAEEFQRAIELDPQFVAAYTSLSYTLRLYARIKGPPRPEREALMARAREASDTALAIDSEDPEAVLDLAIWTENPKLKIQILERALELDPNHERSYFYYGHLMWQDGQLDEAERLFRKALDYDPLDANMLADYGYVLRERGRNAEADAEIEKTLRLQPELVQSHGYLSETEFYRGRNDLSLVHVRAAFAADPQYGARAAWIADVYANMGGREEALAWMELAIDLSPTSPAVWMHGILMHKRLFDWGAAVAMAVRALEYVPGHESARYTLAANEIREGRVAPALETFEELYPFLFSGEEIELELPWQLHGATMVAHSLVWAGEDELARRILRAASEFLDRHCGEKPPATIRYWDCHWRTSIAALQGDRERTLAVLREEIVERNRRYDIEEFDMPEFDFVRDDPEFTALVEVMRTDLAQQLQNVRQMEARGELAPGHSGPAGSGQAREIF